MLLTTLTLFSLVALPQDIGGPWITSMEFTTRAVGRTNFGEATAAIPDLDGDGLADFLIGDSGEGGIGAAHLYSSQNGTLIRSHVVATGGEDFFGEEVAALGDLDADGFAEYAIGARGTTVGGISPVGSVFVYSGATGAQLLRMDGIPGQMDYFGTSISGIGDLNGDGTPDLIVGAFLRSPGGAVIAYSGFDGSELYQIIAPVDGDWFGHAVASAGDINADGIEDVMIGAPTSDVNNLSMNGMVEIYSGVDGSLLRRMVGESSDDRFGEDVAKIADLNGDGFPEHLIGARNAFNESGAVYLYSGSDGSLMRRFDSPHGKFFGQGVGDAGDVDGDGLTDLLVHGQLQGAAWVLSGATGAILSRLTPDPAPIAWWVVYAVTGVGDQDGDGHADLLLSDWTDTSEFRVRLLTGLNPYLTVSPQSLSISSGGSVHWDIDFPATEAGRSYQLFPSPVWGVIRSDFLGTAYGLGDSRLLRKVITGASVRGMTGREGILDANGDATADLVLPAGGYAAYLGDTMYWIAVVIPMPRHPTLASSAVGVKLLP
jgi:hypothetical protein